MNKVNLLKAHCTLCLGSQITRISTRATHCLGICETHTVLHSNTNIIALGGGGYGKGMDPAGDTSCTHVARWIGRLYQA